MKKCPKCKTKISETDIFCWQCGYRFEETVPVPIISKKMGSKKVKSSESNTGKKTNIATIIWALIAVISIIGWIYIGSKNTVSDTDFTNLLNRYNNAELKITELTNSLKEKEEEDKSRVSKTEYENLASRNKTLQTQYDNSQIENKSLQSQLSTAKDISKTMFEDFFKSGIYRDDDNFRYSKINNKEYAQSKTDRNVYWERKGDDWTRYYF